MTVDKDGNYHGLPDEWIQKLDDMVIEDTKNGISNASEIKEEVVNFFNDLSQVKTTYFSF